MNVWEADTEEPTVEVMQTPPKVALQGLGTEAIRRKQADELKTIEDELLRSTLTTVAGTQRFSEIGIIEVDDCKIPREWIERLGLARARQEYRLALCGAMPGSEAPVALKVAMAVSMGIVKARAMEQAAPREMNATLVIINPDPRVTPDAIARVYPRKEITE